jgi:A/G-specific adenine glycosylase
MASSESGEAGLGEASAVLRWYDDHARDLPWRRPGAGPWAVLVSEVMLQQTPVSRVLPAYDAWLARWPTPSDLAAEPAGEAVRQWGRLGYPRRALRLHAAARTIVAEHAGRVPEELEALLALPGIGAYTARAVAAFAFSRRHPVLDTNVRRVLARAVEGTAAPRRSATAADRRAAEHLLPADPALATRTSLALMELGALICTARRPRCAACPVRDTCSWRRSGCAPQRRQRRNRPGYAGSDRQTRGALLAVFRDATGPVSPERLASAWPLGQQRERALSGLLTDGLVEQAPGGYTLPR